MKEASKAAMATTNEERRRILCAQHGHLRQTVAATQQAARALLAGRGSVADLQAAIEALEGELRAHLADEERLLEPILATIDAWGPVRLELLRAEHAHQRAVLAALSGPTASPTAPLVAERMLSLCADVLNDMESEERELLNEKVFRDDLVLLDASDC